MLRILLAIPLIVFLALAIVFGVRLMDGGATNEIPSPLIGKPLPAFTLEAMPETGTPPLTAQTLTQIEDDRVYILNVWASWCGPCRVEHPFLEALSKRSDVVLLGVNYKDSPQAALRFLNDLGNPYAAIGADTDGKASLDLGVYGVPETFLVDSKGMIRAKFVGPLTQDRLQQEVLPAIEVIKSGKHSD